MQIYPFLKTDMVVSEFLSFSLHIKCVLLCLFKPMLSLCRHQTEQSAQTPHTEHSHLYDFLDFHGEKISIVLFQWPSLRAGSHELCICMFFFPDKKKKGNYHCYTIVGILSEGGFSLSHRNSKADIVIFGPHRGCWLSFTVTITRRSMLRSLALKSRSFLTWNCWSCWIKNVQVKDQALLYKTYNQELHIIWW